MKTEQVNEILTTIRTRTVKPVMFGKEIENMREGEGYLINDSEWTLKTSPSSYYYQKYRKSDKVRVSVYRVKDGHLVVRRPVKTVSV